MIRKSREKPVACPECGKPYLTDESVVRHYKLKHQRSTGSRRPYRCGNCDEWVIKPPYEVGENTFCSIDCRSKFRSRNRSGRNHPNWKGGSSSNRGRRWKVIRMYVRHRDGGCQACGTTHTPGERGLHVHHIIPEADVPDEFDPHLPVNLVSLCASCHKQMEDWPLDRQLAEYDIDSLRELLLDEADRDDLNEFIEGNLPDGNTITVEDNHEFINQVASPQRSLSHFE